MQTKALKYPRQKIARELSSMTIHWTPIEQICERLEAKVGHKFNRTEVSEYIRNCPKFTIAWGPGGRCLMATNRPQIGHFVDIPEAA